MSTLKIISFGPCITAGLPSQFTVPYSSSLSTILTSIKTLHPSISELPEIDGKDGSNKIKGEWCIAINSEYVYEECNVDSNAEIAIIPPISGG